MMPLSLLIRIISINMMEKTLNSPAMLVALEIMEVVMNYIQCVEETIIQL